jgi:hypothetical protein
MSILGMSMSPSLKLEVKADIYRSTLKTVYWRATDPVLKLASYVDWGASLYYPMLRKFFDTFFEGDFLGKGKAIYLAHNKEICDLIPTERLLQYKIQDGWDPLCNFLGESVPPEPFPRSNDIGSFIKRCKMRNARQLCNAGLRFFILLVAILSLRMGVQIAGYSI